MNKLLTRSSSVRASRIMTYTILVICALVCIIPFLWMVDTSFKSNAEAYTFPPTIIPKHFQFDNFINGWKEADFSTFTINTLYVTLLCTLGTVVSSSFVAYGFARFRARGSKILFTLLLATMMLPSQVTLIPQYLLFSKLHMVDTYLPMIIPSWLGGGAFNIFLFYQFFKSLPAELNEAAMIDGANSFQTYVKIILPSVKPVAMAVSIMALVWNWNDFYTPLIYINTSQKYTLSVGLQLLNSTQGNTKVSLMMAVAVLTMIPVLIIFFVFQKYFVEGIKMSGMKA